MKCVRALVSGTEEYSRLNVAMSFLISEILQKMYAYESIYQ